MTDEVEKCFHKKPIHKCIICRPDKFCHHKKVIYYCHKCNENIHCIHDKPKKLCYKCHPENFCSHGRFKGFYRCKICQLEDKFGNFRVHLNYFLDNYLENIAKLDYPNFKEKINKNHV